MKERGMIKIQETIEEALMGVRTELGKMESVVGTSSHSPRALNGVLNPNSRQNNSQTFFTEPTSSSPRPPPLYRTASTPTRRSRTSRNSSHRTKRSSFDSGRR